ncbi:MAG: hypothetical protein AABW67_03375 [Nanoarchaeota archaeon]
MKINKTNKKIESLLIVGILLISFCSLVSALGTSNVFSETHPLEAYSGQEVVVAIILSNQDVKEGATLKAEILEGSEISSFDKERYDIKYNEQITARLIVKIPEDVSLGKKYHITHKFTQIQSNDTATGVTFSQNFQGGFDVIVVQKPGTESPAGISTTIIYWIIGIIVVIAIVWFVMKKKNE